MSEERSDVLLTNVDAHSLVKGNVERDCLVADCLDDDRCRGDDEMRATIGQERNDIALAAKGSHRVSRQFLGWRIALENSRPCRSCRQWACEATRAPQRTKSAFCRSCECCTRASDEQFTPLACSVSFRITYQS